MRIKFQNPPINEVIVGIYFDRRMMVRSEHVGVFWNSMRKEFPVIQQQPELIVPTAPAEIVLEAGQFMPPPRHWLVSADQESLLQIQPNAFLFNWRKRGNTYPHYENVKKRFDELFQRYCDFMEVEFDISAPSISGTELTYSNVVEPGEYWSGPADTSNVVPGFRMPFLPLQDGEPTGFNFVSGTRIGDNTILQLSLRTGTSTGEERKSVLVLEFRTLGSHQAVTVSKTDAWFNTAHEAIGECFMNITDPEIQRKYWKIV